MATNKQTFINELENLKGSLSANALDYFETVIKSKKVNKKEVEKSTVMKDAILKFLQENAGKSFDRTDIGQALFDDADIEESYLLNEKNQIAFNSITAFANQLVTDGKVTKQEVKVGKATKIKYMV
jgi:hypothetical protein